MGSLHLDADEFREAVAALRGAVERFAEGGESMLPKRSRGSAEQAGRCTSATQ